MEYVVLGLLMENDQTIYELFKKTFKKAYRCFTVPVTAPCRLLSAGYKETAGFSLTGLRSITARKNAIKSINLAKKLSSCGWLKVRYPLRALNPAILSKLYLPRANRKSGDANQNP